MFLRKFVCHLEFQEIALNKFLYAVFDALPHVDFIFCITNRWAKQYITQVIVVVVGGGGDGGGGDGCGGKFRPLQLTLNALLFALKKITTIFMYLCPQEGVASYVEAI